jgi:competence ComEA-like helix-hairpin-helix protein
LNWKDFIKDYLTFSRRDRIAIIVIVIVIGSIFFLPKAISGNKSGVSTTGDSSWITTMKKIEHKETQNETISYNDENSNSYQYDRASKSYYPDKNKGELFYFDPNTLSADGWKKLGLRDKTVGTIQNYLSKGGKFRKPEDVSRIYGLFPNEYERIAPYIKIETTSQPSYVSGISENKPSDYTPAKIYSSKFAIVDINSADTTALITLPGIGSKLSARIINFRDKLGGFYSIDQVGETFGLPDSTFQKIRQYLKLETTVLRKMNINTATIDELKAHPYIKYSLANPIIAYRNQHGPFAKLEDLKNIMVVTDDIYSKIVPYLSIQ